VFGVLLAVVHRLAHLKDRERGRARTNRKIRSMKKPIVPAYVAQSHFVGYDTCPRTREEVAVQAGDDDDETLQPHADVDDDRDSPD
jgi:hypothetical protein